MPITAYMKKSITISRATYGKAWNDFINVQSRVRIPSPRLNSFTSLITRNNRKKFIEIMLDPGYKGGSKEKKI